MLAKLKMYASRTGEVLRSLRANPYDGLIISSGVGLFGYVVMVVFQQVSALMVTGAVINLVGTMGILFFSGSMLWKMFSDVSFAPVVGREPRVVSA